MTVRDMIAFGEWHEQMGRGDHVVKVDQRGLSFLNSGHLDVNVVPPPEGETHDAQRQVVFLSMRF